MPLTQKKFPAPFPRFTLEWVLFACWILVQAILFWQYGIKTELEARKYIEQADLLLTTGSVSTPNFWLYSTQIFLIAAAKIVHSGFISVVFVQWLFSWWAALSLYRFASTVSQPVTGFIITLLLIFNFPFQAFNSFLQTESLFFSFTILFSCYLLSISILTWQRLITIALFLLLICFTRPTGLLWVPGSFLYLFFRFFRGFSFMLKVGITAIVSIAFLFFLNAALGSGGELDFMLPFLDERIICGVPTLPGYVDIVMSDNPNSLGGLLYYITHNFGQFSRLAWERSKAFFGLTRSYYSAGHNLYLSLYFFAVYILSIIGLRPWLRQNRYILVYCLSLIGITWLTVIMTCDDWHNRFFLTIVPYFYILAIPAVQFLSGKIKRAIKPKDVQT